MQPVTVVCTSFNRPDLLEVALRTFHEFNTYAAVSRFIVIDDSGIKGCNDHLKPAFPNVDLIYNDSRLGQVISIDRAYAMVTTPYIFHMEEDWEFYRSGFIEASLPILEVMPEICCVWIRSEKDTNGHRLRAQFNRLQQPPYYYAIIDTDHAGIWHGFTFNPSLRRLSDYKEMGNYGSMARFFPNRPWESEAKIGLEYKKAGFRAAIVRGSGYVRHIGENRGIRS